MPPAQPTKDFLKWCKATYGPTKDTHNLLSNLNFIRQPALTLDTNWVEEWTEREWLEGDTMWIQ
jgi:hypothetical protein